MESGLLRGVFFVLQTQNSNLSNFFGARAVEKRERCGQGDFHLIDLYAVGAEYGVQFSVIEPAASSKRNR